MINTLTGRIAPEELGVTLMHEHVTLRSCGAESDTLHAHPTRKQIVERATYWLGELKDRGIRTIVDPAPADIGRDIELSAEVSARTGVQIVAATGLFAQAYGGAPYWNGKLMYLTVLGRRQDFVRYIADMFINEIDNGIGPAKLRCGIIKVASTTAVTDYEAAILQAAAFASNATGCPITTHSDDGLLGREQQRILLSHGVPAHRIVIGHSCNTGDHEYHRAIVDNGSYIGFDRFGYELVGSDEKRMDALIRLMRSGAIGSIVLSNDACFCWAHNEEPAVLREFLSNEYATRWNAHRISDVILPALRKRGVTDDEIHTLMVENPRRYFSGVKPVPQSVHRTS